ncbi:unnamed protein product, partial [marine sediment metagenome]
GVPSIAIDSNNVYIAWWDDTDLGCGTDGDIFFKKKPIGGSWPTSTEVVSTESTDTVGTVTSPGIAIDSNNVYIAWEDMTDLGCGTDRDIFFKKKPIGGAWPTSTEVVSTESTSDSFYPSMAIDLNNVYIVWRDQTDLGCGIDWDIFFKKKLIGGSWPASTEVVSTESTDGSYSPVLAIDSNNIYIVWEDDTDLGCGTDRDIFFKKKPIGGSWPTSTEVVSTE